MVHRFYPSRDLRFHLYEVLDAERLTQFLYFQDRESFEMKNGWF